MSHGGGRGGGNPLVNRGLAAGLARDGFIVVMPVHGNLPSRPVTRPRQARAAMAATLGDARFAAVADPARVGRVGFSLGGAVTPILAGAVPDYPRFAECCRVHPDDAGACEGGGGTSLPAPDGQDQVQALRLKAVVLLDPLAAPSGPQGLDEVSMPALLFRSEQGSVLRAEGNALALAGALPRVPEQHTVPGGHFVLIDPCPSALKADGPECADAPGIDRAAVLREVDGRIAAFLHSNL